MLDLAFGNLGNEIASTEHERESSWYRFFLSMEFMVESYDMAVTPIEIKS